MEIDHYIRVDNDSSLWEILVIAAEFSYISQGDVGSVRVRVVVFKLKVLHHHHVCNC
jgi:hypothetical protein